MSKDQQFGMGTWDSGQQLCYDRLIASLILTLATFSHLNDHCIVMLSVIRDACVALNVPDECLDAPFRWEEFVHLWCNHSRSRYTMPYQTVQQRSVLYHTDSVLMYSTRRVPTFGTLNWPYTMHTDAVTRWHPNGVPCSCYISAF